MAKKRPPKDIPTLERMIQALKQLSRLDKEELLVILKAMLEAEEEQDAGCTLKERTQHFGAKGGRGYYERKVINGCGPYLYLRYWSGGKHRSVYLGKLE